LFPSGSNGKLIFVLQVFALRAVLGERMKLVNRGITVFGNVKEFGCNLICRSFVLCDFEWHFNGLGCFIELAMFPFCRSALAVTLQQEFYIIFFI
jgi:hypothetical protein